MPLVQWRPHSSGLAPGDGAAAVCKPGHSFFRTGGGLATKLVRGNTVAPPNCARAPGRLWGEDTPSINGCGRKSQREFETGSIFLSRDAADSFLPVIETERNHGLSISNAHFKRFQSSVIRGIYHRRVTLWQPAVSKTGK